MFKNLTDFGYKRTKLEAFGFYVAYFVFGFIIGAVANVILVSIISPGANTSEAVLEASKIASPYVVLISCVYTTSLAALIMKAKGLFKDFGMIVLLVVTTGLTAILGCLGGLIPVAIISTSSNKN